MPGRPGLERADSVPQAFNELIEGAQVATEASLLLQRFGLSFAIGLGLKAADEPIAIGILAVELPAIRMGMA